MIIKTKVAEETELLIATFDNDGIKERQLEYKRTIEFVETRSEFLKKEVQVIENKEDFKKIKISMISNQMQNYLFQNNMIMTMNLVFNRREIWF